MEKYWISLFPDTFLWLKKNHGFVYNAIKFKGFRFILNDRIEKICQELLLPANLYTTGLTSHDIECKYVKQWVHSITQVYAAGSLSSGTEKRPVSFKPILKMFTNLEFYIWEHHQGFGSSIMKNIHELTFYINNSDTGNDTYFRQAIFPLKNCTLLDSENMLSFIRHSQNPFLSNINLVGNIFMYPNFRQFIEKVACLAKSCTIRITIQDFTDHIRDLKSIQWPVNIHFNVLIDTIPVRSPLSLHDIEVSTSVTVMVLSENGYNLFFDQFKDKPIYCDARVIPFYNGSNHILFDNNVFIDQDDLDEISLTKREIFIHQTLNTNDFGRLTIFPDGSVYANVNMEPLGTSDNSVYSLVYKELTEGKSWLRIRNQAPCIDCVYQWLCPSPTNYEIAIERPNLCHIDNALL